MDTKKLRDKMREIRVSTRILAKKMGILPSLLNKKLEGSAEFTLGDIVIIQKELSLSKDEIQVIFFT